MSEIIKNILTTELGIAGLCVSGLIALLVVMILLQSRRDSIFRKHIDNIFDEHRKERTDWRNDISLQNNLNREVISRLEQTIRDILN